MLRPKFRTLFSGQNSRIKMSCSLLVSAIASASVCAQTSIKSPGKSELAAPIETSTLKQVTPTPKTVLQLCQAIGKKLGSVRVEDCINQELVDSGLNSTQGYPLAFTQFPPVERKEPRGRILLLGGIHGDEYASVSVLFKWMSTLKKHHSGLFNWQVIPLANPDGLLQRRSQRQNGRGVDLNRNFPTPDWEEKALAYWEKHTYKNIRRFPGHTAGSEIETQWLMQMIEKFQPDAIISVHAPHKLIDFDGPHQPPQQLGKLQLRPLGTYPGSLGNYGGTHLSVPVLTVELPFAGIMPTKNEISTMWTDLVKWLIREVPKQKKTRLADANEQAASKHASQVEDPSNQKLTQKEQL